MTLAAGSRLGPYEVQSPLGAGGMGEVWRARDTRLGREVAIKVLPADVASDPSRLKRFEKEARSASALNHPNIVTIYDIGSSDSISYIAMELVAGKTLREALFSGPLPVKRLLQIATQIADGLARAHEAGIVHRDLKPENVMVTKDGLVKILDFGLAKLTQTDSSGEESRPPTETGTRPGVVLGTVGYMSPEQASGALVDFRSDQFSFGSILYEMATGKRAFQKGTAVDTLSAILHEDPKPVAEMNPQVPAPLRWIVEQCLAKEPEVRYASTKDLARELSKVRDHLSEAEPVYSKTPRTYPRLWIAAVLSAVVVAVSGVYLLRVVASGGRRASVPSFHRLTFRRGELGNARFAPDGQTIVYSASWSGEERQIYSTRIDSPESRPLGFGRAEIVAISSAGEMAIELLKSGVTDVGTLARVPMAGGVPREILEGMPWVSADWSPDGKNLAVVRLTEGENREGRNSLECPIGKVLLDSTDTLRSPRISPRGDRIAFFENGSLAIIKSSGGDKKVLSPGAMGNVPCWTADGGEIWYNAVDPERGFLNSIYAVDLSGRHRLVTRLPGDLELHDISRDGRMLLSRHNPVSVLMAAAPGEPSERELSWLDGSWLSDLSDDGRTLISTEVWEGGGPNGSIYLRKTDGSPAVRLGEGHATALSPDGKRVLGWLPSGGGLPPRLVLIPTGAGEPTTLEYREFNRVTGANWFPGGERVLFAASGPGHGVRLYIQEIAGGSPRPVTPEGVGHCGITVTSSSRGVSPDGKFVIAGTAETCALYPVEGGTPRPIRGLEAGDHPIQWSRDRRGVYVFRAGRPVSVWLLNMETGERRLWKEIHQSNQGFDTAVIVRMTPDGRSYAYSWNRNLSELYLVDGLR